MSETSLTALGSDVFNVFKNKGIRIYVGCHGHTYDEASQASFSNGFSANVVAQVSLVSSYYIDVDCAPSCILTENLW